MGVSDRSHRRDGSYKTMPAVISLLKAQRQIAVESEVAFWNTFAAMGGQNSMIKYVEYNWASKDYTHLSFQGGKELAKALFDAIITEKNMYDADERLLK
jgi:lysophospholipase L1-like esterase